MSITRHRARFALPCSLAVVAAITAAFAQADATTGQAFSLKQIGLLGGLGAEIVAYDASNQRAWVSDAANAAVSIVDLADPANPQLVRTVSLAAPDRQSVTSVAISARYAAVGTRPDATTGSLAPGKIVLLDLEGTEIGTATAGYGPDAVTFTPDGNHLLVANEGEPTGYGSGHTDPEGSISIIAVTESGFGDVREVGFGGVDPADVPGLRISSPVQRPAQDIEPEYIAVSADSRTAYVTLQENNAVAEINIADAGLTAVRPVGYADHSTGGAQLDTSDRDGPSIRIEKRTALLGMRMPDAIATFADAAHTYYVTANEGDGRDYAGFSDERRVGAVPSAELPARWGSATPVLRGNAEMGRLTVTRAAPWSPGGPLYAYGSRSISVFDGNGNLLADTGKDFERITAAAAPTLFNSELGDPATFDTRSDNKGPEPEGVAVAHIDGRRLAAVTLERTGGVMLYDLSNPAHPEFVDYIPGSAANASPEGVTIVPAGPGGQALVLTASETGNALTVYEIVRN